MGDLVGSGGEPEEGVGDHGGVDLQLDRILVVAEELAEFEVLFEFGGSGWASGRERKNAEKGRGGPRNSLIRPDSAKKVRQLIWISFRKIWNFFQKAWISLPKNLDFLHPAAPTSGHECARQVVIKTL